MILRPSGGRRDRNLR